MNIQFDNTEILKDFLRLHNLSFSDGTIGFQCLYDITLPNTTIEVPAKVSIDVSNNGNHTGVVNIDSSLSPLKYPVQFLAMYSDMKIEDYMLRIEGKHKILGDYVAYISVLKD